MISFAEWLVLGLYAALIAYAIVNPLVMWRTLRRIETKLDRAVAALPGLTL